MGAKRILALGSVAALCAGAAAPLFMASAASAIPNADFICVNFTTQAIVGVNLTTNPGGGAGFCDPLLGQNNEAVSGPQGGTGPQGPTGAAGGVGPAGNAGPKGQHGAKGPAGPTGAQGAPGGAGAVGNAGPQGPTGPQGASVTGPGGGQGPDGNPGVPGPQGATGPQGPTGATATLLPVVVDPGCPGVGTCAPGTFLRAMPGDLGNTLTGAAATGSSQIRLSCPPGTTLISGGANLIPGDINVRGILESSYPNPTNASQWIITAEVTQTSTVTPFTGSQVLLVDPYVTCRG